MTRFKSDPYCPEQVPHGCHEGWVALAVEEQCEHNERHDCKKHGPAINCITGYVDRRCDTDKGIFTRLLTEAEVEEFAKHWLPTSQADRGVRIMFKAMSEHGGTYTFRGKPVSVVPCEETK
jgi:hypothetical protein